MSVSPREAGRFIGAEEFVRLWQASTSVDEFVAKTGIPKSAAYPRACRYRKRGVGLKKFVGRNGGRKALDWSRMAKIAKAAAK